MAGKNTEEWKNEAEEVQKMEEQEETKVEAVMRTAMK